MKSLKDEIIKEFKGKLTKIVKEVISGCQLEQHDFSFLREEIHFRLKNKDQKSEFYNTLFKNKIPHISYVGDVITTSANIKQYLENLGFELEIVDPKK